MRRSKYGVRTDKAGIEERTVDGIVFDSKKEMLCYVNQFRPLMRSGLKVQMQVQYELYAANLLADQVVTSVGKYIADFVVTEKDGTVRVYDAKGFKTPEYRLKKKIFEANYPHLRIVEI